MMKRGPEYLSEPLPTFQRSSQIEDWTRKEFWLDLLSYAHQHAKTLRKAFDAFSDVGGYPECHKHGEKRILGTTRAQLVDDIRKLVVERTLAHDLKAGPGGTTRDGRVLEEAFRLVCRYAGQAIPTSTIGKGVRDVLRSGVSDKTVHDAIRFLAHALLVRDKLIQGSCASATTSLEKHGFRKKCQSRRKSWLTHPRLWQLRQGILSRVTLGTISKASLA